MKSALPVETPGSFGTSGLTINCNISSLLDLHGSCDSTPPAGRTGWVRGWCQSLRGRMSPWDYGDPCGRPPAAAWAGDPACRQSPASPGAAVKVLLLLQLFSRHFRLHDEATDQLDRRPRSLWLHLQVTLCKHQASHPPLA